MCFFSPRVHQRHNQPALNLSLPVECGSFRKCGWGICLGWTDGYPGAVSGNLTCVDVLSVRLVDDGEGTEVLLPLDRYPDAGPPTQVTQCCLRWDPPPTATLCTLGLHASLARTVPCCPVPARLALLPDTDFPKAGTSHCRSRSLIPKGMPGQVSGHGKAQGPLSRISGQWLTSLVILSHVYH